MLQLRAARQHTLKHPRQTEAVLHQWVFQNFFHQRRLIVSRCVLLRCKRCLYICALQKQLALQRWGGRKRSVCGTQHGWSAKRGAYRKH
jgi:hypothetical protein